LLERLTDAAKALRDINDRLVHGLLRKSDANGRRSGYELNA
jgi:hypothetical protein